RRCGDVRSTAGGVTPGVYLPRLRGARSASTDLGEVGARLRATGGGINSGEGGIRTLGTLADTHDFQSCTFGHSVTSPGHGTRLIRWRAPGFAERVGVEPTV